MKLPRPLFFLPGLLLAISSFPQTAPPKKNSAPAKAGSASKAAPKSTAPSSAAKKSSPAAKTASSKGKSKKGQSARNRKTRGQQTPEEARVREIQQALAERGYGLELSGKMDPQTVEALKKFQEEKGIKNMSGRGKLDSLTLIALGLGPKQENLPPGHEAPKAVPEGKTP